MADPRLPAQTKQPWEERRYNFDFRAPTVQSKDHLVPSGRSIASVDSVDVLASQNGQTDLTVKWAPVHDTDAVVQVTLAGGTDGEDYPVRVRVIDDLGQQLEGDGIIKVRDL